MTPISMQATHLILLASAEVVILNSGSGILQFEDADGTSYSIGHLDVTPEQSLVQTHEVNKEVSIRFDTRPA